MTSRDRPPLAEPASPLTDVPVGPDDLGNAIVVAVGWLEQIWRRLFRRTPQT